MESSEKTGLSKNEQSKSSDYQQPEVRDYGSLLELTQSGTFTHGDVPHGVDNAFS